MLYLSRPDAINSSLFLYVSPHRGDRHPTVTLHYSEVINLKSLFPSRWDSAKRLRSGFQRHLV